MSDTSSQNSSSLPIAIFDSGIGGLSVLCEALKLLPSEDYLYFADTDHVPYGTRKKEDVKELVLNAGKFLVDQKIKMLVIACNTATSIAISELRNRYTIPVLGMEPAVKPAVSNNKNKRVLVLATELTLKEHKFRELVDKVDNEKIVDMLPLPELVVFAEQFIFDDKIIVPALEQKLAALPLDSYGTVVLGCTHFPFYKNALKKIFPPGTEIIDGNIGTVTHMKNILEKEHLVNPQSRNGKITFYHSGKKITDEAIVAKYLRLAQT
ncbi:MAG: glutamate racemase [Bacteroidota bacterium]